jgi:hypothetical protein
MAQAMLTGAMWPWAMLTCGMWTLGDMDLGGCGARWSRRSVNGSASDGRSSDCSRRIVMKPGWRHPRYPTGRKTPKWPAPSLQLAPPFTTVGLFVAALPGGKQPKKQIASR